MNAKVNSAVEVCNCSIVLLHFHLFLLQIHWSVSSKLGCYSFFWDELTYPLHPRTSSPVGWGQGCELILLQNRLQNTRRCCSWSSPNSLHLWNLNGFTFSSFRGILRVVALEKSNFLAIWQNEEVGGYPVCHGLLAALLEELLWKFWLSG